MSELDWQPVRVSRGEVIKGRIEPPCIIAMGLEPGMAYRFEEQHTGQTFYGTADEDGRVKAVPL